MTGPLAQQFAQVREESALLADWAEEPLGMGSVDVDNVRGRLLAALSVIERHVQDMKPALDAARLVADMHESGEGFQWVGSEDDTEALDALCRALAALPAREKGTE